MNSDAQIARLAPMSGRRRRLAVVGSGISGLSAAWLLSQAHDVTLLEADNRLGGHSNTVEVAGTPVDTGFIVYNEATYPNLTALFRHLNVETLATDMSFAVTLDAGRLEYSGSGLGGLFAQARNLIRPRFWSMLADLVRFYRQAPADVDSLGLTPLDDYLKQKGYGDAFRDDHLYPMAAAIWSTPTADVGRYPAASFIRFCQSHGLLLLTNRPIWRTVKGGSRSYVNRLLGEFRGTVTHGRPVTRIMRTGRGVEVTDAEGGSQTVDDVVIAAHADQALKLLADPSHDEQRLLGAFGYSTNRAVLHSDPRLMPKRRKVWSAWNYAAEGHGGGRELSVTYWMNALQSLPADKPLFVTLNPLTDPDPALTHHVETYEHPQFNAAAMAAQGELWSLQGQRNTWFCGAYFGAGFHEDGLQAGLAVAEDLGGVRRPWQVADESGRIVVTRRAAAVPEEDAA